ncbi:MAG: hypothetical protein HC820_05670 [Hydrococcus sp. RM1_1_31]|nr:hypothetical protein [Hydrococcus sp. RM1_1_31]
MSVEQIQSSGVLQNTPKAENQSVEIQTKQLPKGWDEQNPFAVGEQIIDVLTKIRGVVVGVEGEKVFFHCRELGRVWRQWEMLMKI